MRERERDCCVFSFAATYKEEEKKDASHPSFTKVSENLKLFFFVTAHSENLNKKSSCLL
jgi:hypothetical protein